MIIRCFSREGGTSLWIGSVTCKPGLVRCRSPRGFLLVVHVGSGTFERGDYLLGPENRELWRHAKRRLRNGHRNPLCGQFGDVVRDLFARFDGAFQIAPDRVSRHFARFFQGPTIGADLRNGRHEHAESPLREGFKDGGVAVFRHDSIVRGLMPRSLAEDDDLIESLKNQRQAKAYLNAALEDGDPRVFLMALRNLAHAYRVSMRCSIAWASTSRWHPKTRRRKTSTGEPVAKGTTTASQARL